MRVHQDQIQALAQPRQRRAEPEKGFRAAFFISHKTQNYRAPNDVYIFQSNMINS